MKKDFRTKNLLSAEALNPQFVEVHDCIILASASSELIPMEQPKSHEDRQKAEYSANRRDIWELFEVPPPEPTPRLLCEAGNAVKDIWEGKLTSEFPSRRFVVYFEYAPPICEISFFQALDWHIAAEAQAKADGKRARRVDWRPKLVGSPLLPRKK